MNILASYRYQMADHKKSILIFYLVIVALICVASVSSVIKFHGEFNGSSITVSGGEFATLVFLFVVGLCTFKETFLFSIQNGSSRKTIFVAKLLTMVSVAAIMSLVDTILYLIQNALQGFTFVNTHAYRGYELFFMDSQGENPVLLQIKSFFLEFLIALTVMAAGYLITVLFYRLNKAGKIAVSVGVPMLFMFGFPLLDYVTAGAFTKFFAKVFSYAFGTPLHMFISCFILFAVANGLAFLLARKAVVR